MSTPGRSASFAPHGPARAAQTPGAVVDAVAQARRWYWQRLSAMVLAMCVLVHLVVMVVAMRGGLTGAEILERTRGNLAFAAFYGCFVLACAVHVPIGLATVAREWGGLRAGTATWLARAFGALLLVLGLRAVWAVYAGGG